MNKQSTSAKLVCAIMLTLLPALAFAQQAVPYEPLAGDLVVSFFHSEPLIEHWNDTPEQTAILKQLEPMHSEPVTMQKYILGLHE
jgi:hypothetical protein